MLVLVKLFEDSYFSLLSITLPVSKQIFKDYKWFPSQQQNKYHLQSLSFCDYCNIKVIATYKGCKLQLLHVLIQKMTPMKYY